jgi:hypothetical protein
MISWYDFKWDDVDAFFQKEETQNTLKYASVSISKAIDQLHEDMSKKLSDYLADEFQLRVQSCITDRVFQVVQKMLLGDEKVLEEFNLAPANWGLRCDPHGIRRKIVEANADLIKNTYTMDLEQQLLLAREQLEIYRSR